MFNRDSEGLGQGRRNRLNSDKERRRYEEFEENHFDEEKRKLEKEFIKHIIKSRDKAFARCEFWSAEKFEAELWKFAIWRREQFEKNRFETERNDIMKSLILYLQKKGKLALCDEWTPEEFEVQLRKFAPVYFARKEEALAKKRKNGVNPPVLDGADPLLKCVRSAPVELCDPNACRAVAQDAGTNSNLQCVRSAPIESYDDPNACKAVGQDAGVDSDLQCVRDVPAEPCILAASYKASGQDAGVVCVLQCVCDAPAEEPFNLATCVAVGRDANVDCNLRCVCDAPAVEVPDVAACEAAGRKDVDCVLQCVCDAPAKEVRLAVSCEPFARSVCVDEESEAFGWNAVWCAEVEAALPPAQPPPVARGVSCSNHTMIRAALSKKVRGSFLLSDLSLMVSLGWRASFALPARLIM